MVLRGHLQRKILGVKNCSRVSTFCDGVGMLRQTLFSEALPSKKYFVYKNPIDTYQKFVEVFAASTAEENIRHDYVCVTVRWAGLGGRVFF